MLRILLVLILLSHDLAIAACNRYSDADECISSGNSLDLLWSFLATALIWLFIYNSIFKKEQEDNWHKTLSDETEELAQKAIREARKEEELAKLKQLKVTSSDAKFSKETDVEAKKPITYSIKKNQQTKIINCPKCDQKIKIKTEIHKYYEIICPACKHAWVCFISQIETTKKGKLYLPSPALAAVISAKPMARTVVIAKLWDYIKAHGLQDAQNKRIIYADEKLKLLFDKDQISIFELAGIVEKNLS